VELTLGHQDLGEQTQEVGLIGRAPRRLPTEQALPQLLDSGSWIATSGLCPAAHYGRTRAPERITVVVRDGAAGVGRLGRLLAVSTKLMQHRGKMQRQCLTARLRQFATEAHRLGALSACLVGIP